MLPELYRDWQITLHTNIGPWAYEAVHKDYDASWEGPESGWEGPESGWVTSHPILWANTRTELRQLIDEWHDEQEPTP